MPAATPRLSMLRGAARYLTEPHPFARNPVTQAPHSVPWNVYARRVGRAGRFYVSFGSIVLATPFVAAEVVKTTGL